MAITLNGSAGVTTTSGAVYDGIQSGTAVTASGTSVDFTSIPSWVKRITVMFSGVSGSGTSGVLVQLGDGGGIENTDYSSSVVRIASTIVYRTSTAGFIVSESVNASNLYNGIIFISLIGSNNWSQSATIGSPTASNSTNLSSGSKTLSDVLTQVRITTVNGTDTFDAGTINILYE